MIELQPHLCTIKFPTTQCVIKDYSTFYNCKCKGSTKSYHFIV